MAVAWILAVSLALPLVAAPLAVTAEPAPSVVVEDTQWIPVRYFFESVGAEVTWVRETRSIHIAVDGGSIVLFVDSTNVIVNDITIAIQNPITLERGISYIAEADLFELFDIFMDTLVIELPAWITDRTPLARTTDHGQMAVEFILEMNDNFYDRVAFSYRELEAAQWIADQLVAMGHDDVYIQSIHIDDVTEMLLLFDYGWFVDALDSLLNGEQLSPETFFQSESMVATLQALFAANIAALEAMGIADEMIAALVEEMDLMGMIKESLLGHYSMFGIFADLAFKPYTQNVILTIPGQSEQKIVMTAHFDTVLVPGASDNASGVALLMESAYRMLGVDNYYTLVYVFAGAEEVGLLGTYYYYVSLTDAQRNNIVMNINADVLFEGPYFVVGAAQSAFGSVVPYGDIDDIVSTLGLLMSGYGLVENDLTRAVAAVMAELNDTHGTQFIEWKYAAAMPSDQLMFLLAGHTVVAFTGLARAGDPAYAIIGGIMPMFEIDGIGFGASVVHSLFDDIHFINELWPDKIADAMWSFSLLLDALLNMQF